MATKLTMVQLAAQQQVLETRLCELTQALETLATMVAKLTRPVAPATPARNGQPQRGPRPSSYTPPPADAQVLRRREAMRLAREEAMATGRAVKADF